MGVIYKALDRTLNRLVAIKLLHAHFSGDPSFAERFLREARAMAGPKPPSQTPRPPMSTSAPLQPAPFLEFLHERLRELLFHFKTDYENMDVSALQELSEITDAERQQDSLVN